MSNKSYIVWLVSVLLAISWYAGNLGLMEFLRTGPRIATGMFFLLTIVAAWVVGWHPAVRNTIQKNTRNKKQVILFVLETTGILLFVAVYQMYFMVKESNISLAQGGFFMWRAWMAYIGFLIVCTVIVVDFWIIAKHKRKLDVTHE